MKRFLLTLLIVIGGIVSVSGQTQLSVYDFSSLYSSTSFTSAVVHDPSVYFNSADNYYYIFGSHYTAARSKDLRNWTSLPAFYNTTYDKAFKSCASHTVKRCLPGSKVEDEVTLGSYDAAAFCATYAGITVDNRTPVTEAQWVNGDQWAPDVIYNPNLGKWCYYLSLNGDYWSSVIVMMTSTKITGPYKYEAPIIFGGFDGQSRSGVSVDYKNTDLEVVLGTQSSLPSRYKTNKWGTYYPNCIDPCVFFDEEGELWMTYGSWSGGIYIIKLDKNTGLRDYTYTYSGTGTSPNAAALSDAYFGKKIAGGYYVSGEGSYVQHIGDYYYLFMSYGFFSPDGGYEMRVFRSSKPDGPYKDAGNNTATYTDLNKYVLNYGPNAVTNRGMKLIGAMNKWGLMTTGECAQGHNSACTDSKGRNFLVCHTKYNNNTAGHNVRSYQLYQNKDGWLVCAPFQFAGEPVTDAGLASGCQYSVKDIEGDYHVLMHPYKLNHSSFQEATPKMIHLSADGKVTGDYTGSWSLTEGTSYFSIKLGSVTYNGVITEQTLENNKAKTIAFTTVCNTSGAYCGVPVWGYKLTPKCAIAYNYNLNKTTYFRASNYTKVSSNINILFEPEENTTLTWTSSEPSVLSNEGRYNAGDEDVSLTLTARLESGDYYWEKEFSVTALRKQGEIGDQATGLVAYYNFDGKPTCNLYNSNDKVTYTSFGSGTEPVLEDDYKRFGKVIHTYFGAQGNNSTCYIPNPLKGQQNIEGFTVSLWVKMKETNQWDALWSFFDSLDPKASGPRMYLTGNSYLGFNNNAGSWFDINHPNSITLNELAVDEWHLATVSFSGQDGVRIYIDSTLLSSTQMKWTGSVDQDKFDNSIVLDFVKSTQYFHLGSGSFWGSANACFDDLLIYSRALSLDDVKGLVRKLQTENSLTPEVLLPVTSAIMGPDRNAGGVYDLTGRKVSVPGRGIYIINGKKVKF